MYVILFKTAAKGMGLDLLIWLYLRGGMAHWEALNTNLIIRVFQSVIGMYPSRREGNNVHHSASVRTIVIM